MNTKFQFVHRLYQMQVYLCTTQLYAKKKYFYTVHLHLNVYLYLDITTFQIWYFSVHL